MAKWKRDVLVGIGFELFFVIAYISSFRIPVGSMANFKAAQPGVYLRIWLMVFGLLSLALIISAIRKRDTAIATPLFHKQAVITLVLLLIYIMIMDVVGFFISTLMFTAILILSYSWEAGKFLEADGTRKRGAALAKSAIFYLVISAVIVIATQLVFERLLMVNLPSWSL